MPPARSRAPPAPAVVPDLYRGKIGVDAEEASHLMNNLDWAGAVGDIAAAATHLKAGGSKKVAVMGFCVSGARGRRREGGA